MIVYSIDIETAGLDPEKHQILEIGVARGDIYTSDPLDTWHCYLNHSELCMNLYALNMNRDLLQEIHELRQTNPKELLKPRHVFPRFSNWLTKMGELQDSKLIVCGRNFNGFDRQFLKQIGFVGLFRHRVIDPTILYMRRNDEYPPGLEETAKRAGLPPAESHRALPDAIQSLECVRNHFNV